MLRVMDLFAGVGAFDSALDRLGVEYELVDAVEVDKYAMSAFNAIHGTNFECQDITKWDKDVGHIDIMWQSSPCTDVSFAGKQAGADKESGTRSSLVWEVIRIVEKVRPAILFWENVKGVTSKKHKHILDEYIADLDKLGYNSYTKALNSADFLIPQRRERNYVVSIRKDIDTGYEFPKGRPSIKKLKDMLEENPDERYYLPDEKVASLKVSFSDPDQYINKHRRQLIKVGDLDIKGQDNIKRVYSAEGISPTLTTMTGGNRQPKILDDTYKNRAIRVYDKASPTLRAGSARFKVLEPPFRVRRLTPRETYRLQGFLDSEFDKASKVVSASQLYKEAGNSCTVSVLAALISQLGICKKWNDMSLEEKIKVSEGTCKKGELQLK